MFSAQIKWKIDPQQALNNLTSGIKNKAMRIALNAGAAPMKAAVIAAAPSGKGNLKKAIRIKVKNYRANDSWVAIIGASKSFKRVRKLKNKKKDRGGNKTIRPSRYQPIVNRDRHFMESAFNSAKATFASTVQRKLQEIIPQLIR